MHVHMYELNLQFFFDKCFRRVDKTIISIKGKNVNFAYYTSFEYTYT